MRGSCRFLLRMTWCSAVAYALPRWGLASSEARHHASTRPLANQGAGPSPLRGQARTVPRWPGTASGRARRGRTVAPAASGRGVSARPPSVASPSVPAPISAARGPGCEGGKRPMKPIFASFLALKAGQGGGPCGVALAERSV